MWIVCSRFEAYYLAEQEKVVRRIKGGGKRAKRWVKVNMGGEELNLYCDTGSNITIRIGARWYGS